MAGKASRCLLRFDAHYFFTVLKYIRMHAKPDDPWLPRSALEGCIRANSRVSGATVFIDLHQQTLVLPPENKYRVFSLLQRVVAKPRKRCCSNGRTREASLHFTPNTAELHATFTRRRQNKKTAAVHLTSSPTEKTDWTWRSCARNARATFPPHVNQHENTHTRRKIATPPGLASYFSCGPDNKKVASFPRVGPQAGGSYRCGKTNTHRVPKKRQHSTPKTVSSETDTHTPTSRK